MERARVKDWLIGAAGTVLVLVLAVAVLWWVVTDRLDGGEAEAAPSPTTTRGEQPPDVGPPVEPREGEVWLADLELEAGTVVTAGSTLRDVRAVGRDVLTGPNGLVAGQVTVDATVPFEVVADELGGETEIRAAEDGQAMVVRTVEALGRELRVVATGSVDVAAGRLVVEPRAIDIGGPDFLAGAIAAVVRGLVTIEHEIEGLPEGLTLESIDVQDDGFRAHLEGEDVRLVP